MKEIFDYSRHHVFKKFLDFRPSSEPSTEVQKAFCMGLDHPDIDQDFSRDTNTYVAWLAVCETARPYAVHEV